jgi:chemotaxis protein methyltransferase CheR
MAVGAGQITDAEYEAFRQFLAKACGIVLGENKQYLIASRLGRLMLENKLSSLGDLVNKVQQRTNIALRVQVVDAMTTNETQWFRDQYPYEALRNEIFPEFVKRGERRLRVWSSACSSGQEAYSIVMTAMEFNALNPGKTVEVEVVATDISPVILTQARRGAYPEVAIKRGLSDARLQKFFRRCTDGTWEVLPEIRNMVSFREQNLLDSYGALGKFDIIFCRNVLIYFSSESRENVFMRMGRCFKPGGFMVLGASESLSRFSNAFDMVRYGNGVFYRLRANPMTFIL